MLAPAAAASSVASAAAVTCQPSAAAPFFLLVPFCAANAGRVSLGPAHGRKQRKHMLDMVDRNGG